MVFEQLLLVFCMCSSIYIVFYCMNVYPICTKGQKSNAASAAAESYTHHGCQTSICICLCIRISLNHCFCTNLLAFCMFCSIYSVFYCINVYPLCTKHKKIAANAAATRWAHHGCQTGVCICLCIKRPWKMIDFEPKPHIPQPVVHTHLLSSCCMPDA